MMVLQFIIDGTDWTEEELKVRGLDKLIEQAAKLQVDWASLGLKGEIQRRMPVDTGAARSSWGAPDYVVSSTHSNKNLRGQTPGIWFKLDNGLTILQGSRLRYITYLNEGSSKQAPAGFIDASYEKWVDKFVSQMAIELEKILS